jgi:DNA-binding NarL/FixJ family response regulator
MRILLADKQPQVRFALRVLLERQSGYEVVGEAVNTDDLLSQTKISRPDLVLLDWDLPGLAKIGSIAPLKRHCPHLFVAVLSGRLEARHAALSAGADTFVSKSEPPEILLAAIKSYQRKQALG